MNDCIRKTILPMLVGAVVAMPVPLAAQTLDDTAPPFEDLPGVDTDPFSAPFTDDDIHAEEEELLRELQEGLEDPSQPDEEVAEEDAEDEPFRYGAAERAHRLDRLFETLAKAPSPAIGRRIASSIQTLWNDSGSATVNLLTERAREAFSTNQTDVALDLLDQALMIDPEFAEAWNIRATVNFSRNDYAKSMADIERVLALEPRHFGALTGMGTILRRLGRDASALAVYERVLELFPALASAKDAAEELEKSVENRSI